MVNLSMSNQTAFNLFGLSVSLQLDLEKLDDAYRCAQNQVHPDRFVGKTPMEQSIAASQAILINDAYQRLKSPLLRAQEILKSRNLSIPGDKGQTIQHPSLLIEIMDLRERLNESTGTKELEILRGELQGGIHQIEEKFETLSDEDIVLSYLRYVYLVKLIEDATSFTS